MAGNTDLLSADNILGVATSALRRDGGDQPSLKNPYEAVALVGHACMIAVGFRLVGLGEEHTLGLQLYLSDVLCWLTYLLDSQNQKAPRSRQDGTLTTIMPFDMLIHNLRCNIYSRLAG